MKLSDVKGERTLDVVADIIGPITSIAEDKAAAELFARKKLPDGMSPREFILRRVKKSVPALMKAHKADLIAILSAIEGTTPKKYTQDLTLAKLVKDCVELLTDESFEELFISAQSEDSSGSAQENTEAPKA